MTVTTSYPGIYIQELPSLAHTITPAPTSIAVFVGYTNPFFPDTSPSRYKTAIQLFSFADYQTNFGGFFSCPWQPDYVGQAVFQFFQNGGPTCYVVALQAKNYYDGPGGALIGQVGPASVTFQATGGSITFTAKQPVGVAAAASPTGTAGIPMTVALSINQSPTQNGPTDTADIVISYGTTVETYRKIQIASLVPTSPPKPPAPLQNSSLVTVTLTDQPTAYQQAGSNPLGYGSLAGGPIAPQLGYSVISLVDFEPVFQKYAPLDKIPIFNLLATPGITDSFVTSEAVAYCEGKRAFYITDTPSPQVSDWDVNSIVGKLDQSTPLSPAPPVSINAAVYYPWLQTADPVTGNTTDPVTGKAIVAPPSGFVAGIYGQTDSAQGVWQSPAGLQTTLLGTTGVDTNGVMTDPQQGILNNNAINCLRQFPSIGTVVFGARTTAAADPAYQQWKYVAVRRMALFIEQTLYANLGWAVFEGNSTPLWNALTQEVTAFMLSLFRQGAFAGDTPKTAFVVQCDSTTTTPDDVANGKVNILVGFAPLLPAEFVIVKIAQLAGQTQS
jgi:phage tail sheath protein FI